MSDGIDKLLAYRTMRAVQKMAEPTSSLARLTEGGGDFTYDEPAAPPSLWQRWQAAVYRLADKLLG